MNHVEPGFKGMLPSYMEAARFYGPRDLRIERVPLPPPQPGEVILKIEAALTCGTDLKCFRRGHPVLLNSLPSLFGHEGSGTVVAVGKGVTRFKPGDRVVAANSAPCGACFFCQKQQPNLCDHLELLNGTYAQYLTLPPTIVAKNTYLLPPTLSFEHAAFVEPLAVALRGVMETSEAFRKSYLARPALIATESLPTMAILGIGPIGLLMAKVASMLGAQVVAFGRNPAKRSLAKTFGQAQVVIPLEDETSLLLQMDSVRKNYTPEGRGFDVVIEAIGLPEMWEAALHLVRRGGTVNLFGGCPGGTKVHLDTQRLHYDEITLKSLFHHTPYYIQQALGFLSETDPGLGLDPSPLVTTRLPLTHVIEALTLMETGKAVKIALFPQ